MRYDFLASLHCPYSGSQFSVTNVLEESSAGIRYGIITSEAGDFPIIDGILRLKVDEYWQPLVNLIRDRKGQGALLTALDTPFHDRRGAANDFLCRLANKIGLNGFAKALAVLKMPLFRALTADGETLVGTVKRLNAKSWGAWQVYRYSMPTFLSVYPLLHLIRNDQTVLDFGSGLGHASFLISKQVKGSRITCADYSFSALYLARKFFVAEANFVCLDGDYLLPFDSGYFSYVFSSDALHCIDSKLSLSQEFRRILPEKGTVILPHLHNRLSPVKFGKPLSPSAYSELFPGMEKRVVPEHVVVDQYVRGGLLDLEKEWTEDELQAAVFGLSLVASTDKSVFANYKGIWDRNSRSLVNPTINPIYQIERQSGGWLLRKQIPECYGPTESLHDLLLPDIASIELPSLERDNLIELNRLNPTRFSELVRNLIIIDVPRQFH